MDSPIKTLMSKIFQKGSDAMCFKYGEHILPHARLLPHDQDDNWSIANTNNYTQHMLMYSLSTYRKQHNIATGGDWICNSWGI